MKPLLEAILTVKIKSVEIRRDRELMKDLEDDKTGIIDVKTILDDCTKVNIEIQLANKYNIVKRSLFYLSKLYVEGFKKGEKYFQDAIEIHFLELPKIEISNMKQEALIEWLEFIKADDDEVIKMLSDKNANIHKAAEKLEEISSDEEIRSKAANRAKYLSDYTSDMEGSYQDGVREGIEQGLLKKQRGIIKKALAKGYSFEEIAELVEITIDEVEKIAETL